MHALTVNPNKISRLLIGDSETVEITVRGDNDLFELKRELERGARGRLKVPLRLRGPGACRRLELSRRLGYPRRYDLYRRTNDVRYVVLPLGGRWVRGADPRLSSKRSR